MLVCLLLFTLLVSVHALGAKNLHGDFPRAPNDGFSCHWYEGGSGTGTQNRDFRVVCRRENQATYECTYRGNPHNCGSYNGNEEKYYKCLARDAARQTGCTEQTLVCDDKRPFKSCGNAEFKKNSRLESLLERLLAVNEL